MALFGNTKVRDVMSESPRAIGRETSAAAAAKAMATEDVGALPLVEEGRLVGIVTDRDLALQVVAQERDPALTPAGEAASGDPVTVRPDDDLETAMELMARHQIRRLPVVEEQGRLVGMVSQADVARHAGEKQTGETIQDISQPSGEARV